MIHYDVTTATATGDTTETSVGTITTSQKAKRILSAGCYAIAAATLTSGEAATGICRLDSADVDLSPCKFPLDVVSILTSGAVAYKPSMHPINKEINGKVDVEFKVTMDMAQTGAFKARGILAYED